MKLPVLVAALAVFAFACGDGERSREETVADDLNGLEEAFNEGDVERIYEDLMALDCRSRLTLQEAEDRFQAQAAEAQLEIEEPLTIEFQDGSATVRAAMSGRADGESKEAVDSFELIFEEDHWRFVDCLGAVAE